METYVRVVRVVALRFDVSDAAINKCGERA
jgi:hypothetical protein